MDPETIKTLAQLPLTVGVMWWLMSVVGKRLDAIEKALLLSGKTLTKICFKVKVNEDEDQP